MTDITTDDLPGADELISRRTRGWIYLIGTIAGSVITIGSAAVIAAGQATAGGVIATCGLALTTVANGLAAKNTSRKA